MWRTGLGFAGLIVWLAGSAITAAEQPLLTVIEGNLPIVLSAPHGGREAVPNVAPREGRGATQFVTVRDDNTAELTDKLAAQIEQQLGQKPFVIVARFERKYIDANRPAASAYESPHAKPVYDAYHTAVSAACRKVLNRWHRGLLVDIHGQTLADDTIFRGTKNRETVKRLLERAGETALTGPRSIFGQLEQRGYTVFPPGNSSEKENSRYNGGHIVTTYGSHVAGGLDAVQLEFGTDLRRRKVLDKTAQDTSHAIVEFAREYLPK